jgi:hypothetical protein
MKKLAATILGTGLLAMSVPASATLIFHDAFDYPSLPTSLSGTAAWDTHSGTVDQMQVVAGSLSYTELAASTGGKVEHLQASTEDVGRDFTPVTGDGSVVYASFLMQCTVAPSTAGDYFFHMYDGGGNTSTAFRGRLYARGAAPGFQFGLIPTSGTPVEADFDTTIHALDTTVFVVLKATMTTGNDTFDLYINPTPGAAEPATPTISKTSTTSVINPTNGVGRIAIRQGGTTSGSFYIDEVRVGTSWASVTPAGVSSVEAWQMFE